MKRIFFLGSLATLILLASCSSSTKVTSSWKDDKAGKINYQKVLVLGVMNTSDTTIKTTMENELANELTTAGINAEPACNSFSPKVFRNMSEERILRTVRTKGYDAIMTIVLLDNSREKSYIPDTARYESYAPYYNRFSGYYRTIYGKVYTPGYYAATTGYFWETNLYEVEGDKLLYSVQSESFDQASYKTLSEEYAKKITKDMVRQGLLARK